MDKNLESALYYESLGFSVIPVAQDKKPLIDWKNYQSERAVQEAIIKGQLSAEQAKALIVPSGKSITETLIGSYTSSIGTLAIAGILGFIGYQFFMFKKS